MQYRSTQSKISLMRRLRRFVNGLGRAHHCCICKKTFFRFSNFRGGWQALSPYLHNVKWTGSDFDNFWCPFCRSHDRERHLTLFFDRLALWQRMRGAHILHLAPEKHIAMHISELAPAQFVQGDLIPSRDGIQKIDVTAIPFPDNTFDWILCNHVLEHVPNDRLALSELLRVLKPGGSAILQTPFAAGLDKTLENQPEITTDQQRIEFYGQEDHVRLYGRDLFDRIKEAGFALTLKQHDECLADIDAARYGVNRHEPLFLCHKPVDSV